MRKKEVISAILVLTLLGTQNCLGSCYGLPSPDGNEERLFAQDVCGGVDNNPPNPTIFTIDSLRTITKIGTYHWNSGQGTLIPGTIGLQDLNGIIYGPWQASGQPGMGGVPNAYWIVTLKTGLILPAGTYEVLDSDPSTWAYNSESDGSGVVSVVGLNVVSAEVTQAPCRKEATDLSIASPTDQYRAGPILAPGSYKIWYGKRTGNQIGQPDSWNTKPVELLDGKFYVFDVSTGDFSMANPQTVNLMQSNPTPGESVVWYKASTQYAYVVCFEGPMNSRDGAVRENNGFEWTVIDDPSPSEPSQWVVPNDTLKQLSNIYRTDREYEFYQGTHIVAGSLDWTDYVLSFDMKSADNDGIGAIVRYQDKDNYYRFIMVQDSGNNGPFRRLEKFVNGVRTVLAEDKDGYLPGQVYRIQFKAQGNDLEILMDGSKILSATDEAFRSGKIGFLSYASLGMEITNVKVVDQYGETLAGVQSGIESSAQVQPSGRTTGSKQGGCNTDPVTGREICVFPNAMTPINVVNKSNNNTDKIIQGGCHEDPATGQMICIDTIGDISGKQDNAQGLTGSVSEKTGISSGQGKSESTHVDLSGQQSPAAANGADDNGNINTSQFNIETSSSVAECNAALQKIAGYLESGNIESFNSSLSMNAHVLISGHPNIPVDRAAKIGQAMKSAKTTSASSDVVFYEAAIDGTDYSFNMVKEGGVWKLDQF